MGPMTTMCGGHPTTGVKLGFLHVVGHHLQFYFAVTPKFRCFPKQKVTLHEMDYELKCTILANPKVQDVWYEFELDGVHEVLRPGEESTGGDIKFLDTVSV